MGKNREAGEGVESMGKKSVKREAKELRQSLEENLEARGLVEKVFGDKVKEYVDLWIRRKQLEADIEERGITVMDEKRGMLVENRSVSLEVQVSRQMLAIYTALGFKDQAAGAKAEGAEEDEL